MKLSTLGGCAGLLFSCAAAFAQAPGPDVIVGDLSDVTSHGTVGTVRAYSLGTISCNIGTQNLLWQTGNNRHPVIAQNVYRLKNGRLEQIGQGWLKHGFTALTGTLCSGPGGCNGAGGTVLGVGCSDPYTFGLNGSQPRLGPKSDINAHTGFYPWPPTTGWVGSSSTGGTTGNAIFKRIQLESADIDPAQNAGALYFVEGQYVTADDATTGNGLNNASYRRVTINSSFQFSMQGSTQRQKPAISAWADHGLGANTPDPNVRIAIVDVPNDGRFYVASKATQNTNGSWHYEFAIENLTSDRSAGSFVVELPTGAGVTGQGFHDINYHSGEVYDNADWSLSTTKRAVSWASPNTHVSDPLSNALARGTLYNFWFDCDVAPMIGNATIGLFKPGAVGDPDSVTVSGIAVPNVPVCAGDLTGDDRSDSADLGVVLAAWNTTAAGDLNGDGQTNETDMGILLGDWGCGS